MATRRGTYWWTFWGQVCPLAFLFLMHHAVTVCCPSKHVILPHDSEPARSPVLHKSAEAEEPQLSSASSSITSKRPRWALHLAFPSNFCEGDFLFCIIAGPNLQNVWQDWLLMCATTKWFVCVTGLYLLDFQHWALRIGLAWCNYRQRCKYGKSTEQKKTKKEPKCDSFWKAP